MVKCSFCGKDLPVGGGKMYVKKEGTIFYFCSNKCEKNQINLGRKPIETKWTESYNKLKKTLLSVKAKEGTETKAKETKVKEAKAKDGE
ncbi:MAG: 50S ribosomal protein L24e [archaeon]|jgi:large subunit ribosomal protein L24e